MIWLPGTVGLVLAAVLLPGLRIDDVRPAAAVVLLSSILNALLWARTGPSWT